MRHLKLFLYLTLVIPVLTGCKTTKSNQETPVTESVPEPVGESLAPGVVSAVIMVTEVSETQQVSSSIQKVLGYGPATDPVAVNTEIRFTIPKDLAIDKKDLIKKDALLTVQLRRAESGMMAGANTPPRWQLISIK